VVDIPTPAETAEALRGDIESEYNGLRDGIEKTYHAAIEDLTNTFHADIQANRLDKEEALAAAGLNRDGSDPMGRPTDA
jgi:hypothetical protein